MVLATYCGKLENGAVMSGDEFLSLYERAEGLEHVELIEGIVYMPSPVSVPDHARKQGLFIEWLAAYEARNAAVEYSPPGTMLLDEKNLPEPDAMLYFKRDGRFTDAGYLDGAPELVVEIANSSASRDLHGKKEAYRRNGVLEYIVWRVQDEAIDWFVLKDGVYEVRQPKDGVIESGIFPGLRLDVPAMLAMDRAKVLAALA